MSTENNSTNIILYGHCTTIMRQRPAESVHLIVTSPPYNIDVSYGNWNDNRHYHEHLDFCRNWLRQAARLLKPGGYICVNFPGVSRQSTIEGERTSNLMDLYGMLDGAGLNFFGNVTWYKARKQYQSTGGKRQRKRYLGSTHCDGILIAQKPPATEPSKLVYDQENEIFMGTHKGLWKITSASETLDKLNPAPWPIEVPLRCIQLLSKEDDIVLDPFNGSGTTCLAAKRLNRRYIGMDISPDYCSAAVKRIDEGENTSYDHVITDDDFWENVPKTILSETPVVNVQQSNAPPEHSTPQYKRAAQEHKQKQKQDEQRSADNNDCFGAFDKNDECVSCDDQIACSKQQTKSDAPQYGHPRFYELLDELAATHSAKNHDYSGVDDPLSNFKEVAEFLHTSPYKVVMCMIGMKISRLKNLMLHPPEVKTESIRDTLKDLSVYGLLARIIDEELGQGNDKKSKTPATE